MVNRLKQMNVVVYRIIAYVRRLSEFIEEKRVEIEIRKTRVAELRYKRKSLYRSSLQDSRRQWRELRAQISKRIEQEL